MIVIRLHQTNELHGDCNKRCVKDGREAQGRTHCNGKVLRLVEHLDNWHDLYLLLSCRHSRTYSLHALVRETLDEHFK